MVADVDNDKILITNKVSSGEKKYKYFIGCKMLITKLSHCV